jgi:hypothetical protein
MIADTPFATKTLSIGENSRREANSLRCRVPGLNKRLVCLLFYLTPAVKTDEFLHIKKYYLDQGLFFDLTYRRAKNIKYL